MDNLQVRGVPCTAAHGRIIVPNSPPNDIIEWLIDLCEPHYVNGYIMVTDTDIYAIEHTITRYSKKDHWVYMVDNIPIIIPSVRRMFLYVYNNRDMEFKNMPEYIRRQIDKLNSGISINEIRIY